MYDLTQLSLQDITEIGVALRTLGKEADSLELVADRCVQHLYYSLLDPVTNKPACVLVRFFRTVPYTLLPPSLQTSVQTAIAQPPELIPADLKCLTLLGTVGDRPEWCDRIASVGHQVIPLASEQSVSQIPMISQLIKAFDLEISCVLSPAPNLLMALERKTCNVFHVPIATDSEFIPSQEQFVKPYGIKSVVGFGGMLASGDLFSTILFSKVEISEPTAHLFKTLPLNIKMSLSALNRSQLFSQTVAV
ncbi:MAG: hypothetical protein AAF716_01270 [Cyanobacteria bacterium P01_D01_bin.1]